jgi:DNA-binding NarL/FixJ family response regulator
MRRVLVVDDQRMFSDALQLALDVQDDLECVGVALTAAEALQLAAQTDPDLILMDVQLPDEDGIEATRRLRAAGSTADVIVLTGRPDAALVARAADAGASGFLLKDQPLEMILSAVRRPSESSMRVDSSTLSLLLQSPGGLGDEHLDLPLTNREVTVLNLLGEGVAPKQVAHRLGISIHTARGYVKSILAKLDSHSVLEAVVTAQRRGLLQAPTTDEADQPATES